MNKSDLRQIIKEEVQRSLKEYVKGESHSKALKQARAWADKRLEASSRFIVSDTVTLVTGDALETGDEGYFQLEFSMDIPRTYNMKAVERAFNFTKQSKRPGGPYVESLMYTDGEESTEEFYHVVVTITGGRVNF